MNLVQRFWSDEDGVILSMETVLLGTIGVLGLTTGLSFLASAVNAELEDLGSAIRGVDQSFAVEGGQNCAGSTAGSSYQQMSVQETLLDMRTGVCQPSISGDVGIAPDDDIDTDIDIDIELEIERALQIEKSLQNMRQGVERASTAENHEPGPGQSDEYWQRLERDRQLLEQVQREIENTKLRTQIDGQRIEITRPKDDRDHHRDDRHSDQGDQELRKHKPGRSKKQGRPHDGRQSKSRQESHRPLKDL
ncbi:MAG: hypothetical protein NXI04_15770 [Planctomycetaceae bacterium]|nr:hypothetical protein [Planctomycetaceae bacterium]